MKQATQKIITEVGLLIGVALMVLSLGITATPW